MKLKHKFVKNIPDKIEDRVLYISIDFASAIHKCCCGCGREVVTPFSPTDWELIFNGETVSLYPSIGNWSLDCKSHYWITNNQIEWAPKWSKEEIESNNSQDGSNKKRYYKKRKKEKFFSFFNRFND